ncbi:histidine kinase [Mediterraneibacter glycyrrhizinilyticus]|nr:sensor histidine kinase [Mediterraneibacter glycyrrhizinilyticus]MBM6853944.1 histidine kinase [Mediterraneibacter glycyrrhizinilyticus]
MKKLLQSFKNLKFRYKLTLLVLAAGLIPVSIIVVYMQSGMMNLLHENEVDNLEKSLEQAVETIENQEQIYENLVDYLSYSQDLRDILTMEPKSDYETYKEYVDVADPLLQMPQLYHREIREITLYAESIEVPHGNTLMPLSRAKEQEWYGQLESGTLMQWTVTRGADQEITASRKFYDGDDITAVLSMSLNYRSVLEPFTNLLLDNMGGIILDADGRVVYAGYSMDEEYRPAQSESLDYIQDNYTCSIREMEGTGWTFCMYRPTEIITRSAMDLLIGNIPLVGICIVLLVLLGYLFSRRIVSCLERLTENMNQIHMGFRKVTVSSNSNDEVGVLIRSFRRMMDQMNHLISEVYEGKIRLQNSEMKALQAQINPHFLYNSLSIINWKALEAGEEEISRVTLALSTYYRTSLNRGETMTTVENELNNIRAYLKIQLIMHDNSFQVIENISLDTEAMCLQTPKLILQPFVENAIDHGLDLSEKEEKCLTVSASQDVDSIWFEIRDNGVGMEKEKAEEITSYQSKGYGVRNVCERIRVLYGTEGIVRVESSPGEGTTVAIQIPKKPEKRMG